MKLVFVWSAFFKILSSGGLNEFCHMVFLQSVSACNLKNFIINGMQLYFCTRQVVYNIHFKLMQTILIVMFKDFPGENMDKE